MAATAQFVASVAPSALSSKRSELAGASAVQGLPVLRTPSTVRPFGLKVVAGGGAKVSTKRPYGPSGGTKYRGGVDASGRKGTGKGVYQFGKKYGANVDGYSPIYDEDEWSKSGNVYAGGQTGILLWALTFGALLLGGAVLVFNTSALA